MFSLRRPIFGNKRSRGRQSVAPKRGGSEKRRGQPDRRLITFTAIALAFGAVMIYSASAVLAYSEGKSTFNYFFLQILWIGLGTVCGYIVYRIPLQLLDKYSKLILFGTVILLVLVLIFGTNLNGAKRWFDLGPFLLQPSELAKLGFVIYLSSWLAKLPVSTKKDKQDLEKYLKREMLPFLFLLLVVGGLIIMQPDLDTTVTIAMTSLVVLFASGRDRIQTLGTLVVVSGTGIIGILAALLAQYRLERVKTYVEFILSGEVQDKRGSGFQIWNSLIAIGSGGVFGVGFGESRQKLFYLQNAAFTDSIFSIIAEELGLVGSVGVILAFLFFMSVGVDIARKAPDRFSSLLALGITAWLTVQAFLTIGGNLAIIPFGGMPLPFISYGGSTTIIAMIAVGLLLNISANSNKSGQHTARSGNIVPA